MLSATVRLAGDLAATREVYVSAWLTTAARSHALDQLGREATLPRKLPLLGEPATIDPHDLANPDRPGPAAPDDRLRLVLA